MASASDVPKHVLLAKQREREAAEYVRQKEALLKDASRDHTTDRFVGVSENLDDRLKSSTVGLVSLSEFQRTRDDIEEEQRQVAAKTKRSEGTRPSSSRKKAKRQDKAKLSFLEDDADENNGSGQRAVAHNGREQSAEIVRLTKDPGVDTSFLPDKQRDEVDRLERETLRKAWLEEQERTKNEEVEVVYSFWDGSGHRRSVQCKKGDDVATFLGKCRTQFPELRGTSVENLMYIKEDLIIPHHYTFYDFIINKARGKSGPLFNFDVHDDVRLLQDARAEKDESHAGKVVERSWYNRFKHIFPASRWEVYDPDKNYGAYRIA